MKGESICITRSLFSTPRHLLIFTKHLHISALYHESSSFAFRRLLPPPATPMPPGLRCRPGLTSPPTYPRRCRSPLVRVVAAAPPSSPSTARPPPGNGSQHFWGARYLVTQRVSCRTDDEMCAISLRSRYFLSNHSLLKPFSPISHDQHSAPLVHKHARPSPTCCPKPSYTPPEPCTLELPTLIVAASSSHRIWTKRAKSSALSWVSS
jgi:hypothetical protein